MKTVQNPSVSMAGKAMLFFAAVVVAILVVYWIGVVKDELASRQDVVLSAIDNIGSLI